jgi:molybdopterin/thiamine biosynthesis adenylyltransferase
MQEIAFRPELYDASDTDVQKRISDNSEGAFIFDTIEMQLVEWAKQANPSQKLEYNQYLLLAKQHFDIKNINQFGNWAYYSWRNSWVHLLPETEFIAVRTNRNQLKITKDEQHSLSKKSIGVIGLSVGHAIALTIVLERICGTIHLADFDTLDLSNINRLRTSVCNIGLPKVYIAAREIAEIDPYINVEIWGEGITAKNADSFVNQLDLLVEVCDSMDIKLLARKVARQNGIPVVMDTNDKGMIDIERFDLEPNRPIFHGLVDETQLLDIHNLSATTKMEILKQIVSFENTSLRLKQSMSEIGKSIVTWPQLASSVELGAGVTCDIVRRILLKELNTSGRFYIDTEDLIA